jgi:hypothetical protein
LIGGNIKGAVLGQEISSSRGYLAKGRAKNLQKAKLHVAKINQLKHDFV